METKIKEARLCVITLTRDRPELLHQAMMSVEKQRDSVPLLRHIIASEQVEELRCHPLFTRPRPWVTWLPLPDKPKTGFASERLARLRSQVLEQVSEDWVAFLDDDNSVQLDHYADLLALAYRERLCAVHSWRQLIEGDGRPFNGRRYPWHPVQERALALWRWCVRHGVITPDSDVVRDGVIDDPSMDNVATVDMNEWLFSTETLRKVGFQLDYSEEEAANQVGEDDRLLARLRSANVDMGCTQRPSLIYRLGGCSNS